RHAAFPRGRRERRGRARRHRRRPPARHAHRHHARAPAQAPHQRQRGVAPHQEAHHRRLRRPRLGRQRLLRQRREDARRYAAGIAPRQPRQDQTQAGLTMWYWLFVAPWLLFCLWWGVRLIGTARTVEQESIASRLVYAAPLVLAMLLLANRIDVPLFKARLWPRSLAVAVVALALEWVGVAFAIWARETLGRLWSGS